VDRTALGFCARTGSAVAVAVRDTGRGEPALLGRWTVDLTGGLVPDQVFHAVRDRDGAAAVRQVEEAIRVVKRVAAQRLEELVVGLPGVAPIGVVVGVVTADQELTATVAEALQSHPLMHAAEGALYREALVDAAADSGLAVTVLPRRIADQQLRADAPVAQAVQRLGGAAGPPWRKEHKRAAAAALAALAAGTG
jgi:hypothetical protein